MLGEQRAFQVSVERQSVNRQTALVDRLTATISEVAESNVLASPDTSEATAKDVTNLASSATTPNEIDTPQKATKTVEQPEILNDGILTAELISSGQIDPMIGMGKVTPKSFTISNSVV